MSPSRPHILITVFFNAPLGGLQSHVRAQALALLRAGWSCTVLCKPGPFADQLADDGLSVVRDDFSDREACVSRTLDAGPFDMVHAHPFASREIGLDVADRMGLPLLLTIHGMYDDGLSGYAARVARVLCVSPAIRDWLVNRSPSLAEKIWIMPNGVDTGLFRPGPPGRSERLHHLGEFGSGPPDPVKRQLLFVSRLDDDKRFILDVLKDTWQRQMETRSFDLRWLIAGDGQNRPALEEAARALNEVSGFELATFLGWQTEERLARLYRAVDLCVAPGRSALDCLASGRPVIAIGSKAYLGLMDQEGLLSGQYTNFGGFGGGAQDYPPGRMFADLEKLVYDDGELDSLGTLGRSFVAREHDQSLLDQRLMDLYGACLSERSAEQGNLPCDMVPIELSGLAFAKAEQPETLADHWTAGAIPAGRMSLDQQGRLLLDYDCKAEEKFYLTNGDLGFAKPGSGLGRWPVHQEAHLRLRVRAEVLKGRPQAKLWIIEYDASKRLKSTIVDLRPGLMEIPFSTSPAADSFRLAIRFSGAGSVRLAPVQLLGQDGSGSAGSDEPGAGRRYCGTSDFTTFRGSQLVFILGSPRSGTTWLLKLLAEHPTVLAADVDNLNARLNDRETLETNVFNPERPFSDVQIRHMFHRLSCANPGLVVVEKTPLHLLHADRIRRLFPEAALVLIERDGRDVVNSLVHVGLNPDAWWQGAPKTVAQAARLWNRYSLAARRCHEMFRPYRLRYEGLLADPEGQLSAVLDWLGLSSDGVSDQVEACRGGRNISIPGVYRKGTSGGWRDLFSARDAESFVREAGEELVRLGYVSDHKWYTGEAE